mgnify:CR=1 FL=1
MRPSRRLLFAWWALHAPMGWLAGALPASWPVSQRDQAINILLGVGTTVVVYAWCRLEAAERGATVPGRSALWAGLLPPVGLPLYLWRTRGLARALRALSLALLYFTATVLLMAGVEAALAR